MDDPRSVVILGAKSVAELPGLEQLSGRVELRFANSPGELRRTVRGAEILYGWEFATTQVRDAWESADRLRWIHWCGAGVDAVLFPELIDSHVLLTNSRGVFDEAMAEYVLALVLVFAKDLSRSQTLQQERIWRHRLSERIAGKMVLIVGAGSIGRAIARLLQACGMKVMGLGRTLRQEDRDFGTVHAQEDLEQLLPRADYVVVAAPLTAETTNMFTTRHFQAMNRTARFINVGRGAIANQTALTHALQQGEIAGAALDVFDKEPLAGDSPLWHLPNVLISPHMSGDFIGYPTKLVDLFLENFERFHQGMPMRNIVDKRLGYVAGRAE